MISVYGLGFSVQNSSFRVQNSGFRVEGESQKLCRRCAKVSLRSVWGLGCRACELACFITARFPLTSLSPLPSILPPPSLPRSCALTHSHMQAHMQARMRARIPARARKRDRDLNVVGEARGSRKCNESFLVVHVQIPVFLRQVLCEQGKGRGRGRGRGRIECG